MATINLAGSNGIINNLTVNGTLTAPNFTVAKPQMVSTTSTNTMTTTSTTYVATPLSVVITPTTATSKILIRANFTLGISNGSWPIFATITRQIGSGAIIDLATGNAVNAQSNPLITTGTAAATALLTNVSPSFVDSPATTSAITYKIYYCVWSGTGYFGYSWTNTFTNAIKQTMSALEIL